YLLPRQVGSAAREPGSNRASQTSSPQREDAMFRANFWIALLAAAPVCVLAQTSFCLELARHGIFDTAALSIAQSDYRESRAAYCRKYQESKNSTTGLFGSYGSAVLDFSQEDVRKVAEMVCSNNFSLSDFRSHVDSFKSVLSDNALQAIK